jgi:heme-degrading monooxygenase HmoA
MSKLGQPYTSGHWTVKPGSEEEFIARWTEFTEWAMQEAPGAESFYLIRDEADPQRFISFGAWDDYDSVSAWRNRPEFVEMLGRCRALCDDFQAGDFVLAATPNGR